MDLEFFTLDVFTSTRLEGNPLAVVRVPGSLRDGLTQETKQRIAKEFNLSETVFLHEDDGGNDGRGPNARERRIDIFTTESEIPFAGHPTIGTAVLVRDHLQQTSVNTLVARAGPISLQADAGGPERVRAGIPHDIHLHAKRLADVVRSDDPRLSPHPAIREAELRAPVFSIVNGMAFLLAKLPSLDVLAHVGRTPLDLARIRDDLLDEGWRSGFIGRYYYVDVGTEDGDGDGAEAGGRRLRTRMVELNLEDPATGSAASALGSYLTLTEEKKGARFEITQGVEIGRKSVISVETTTRGGDGKLEEVWLGGTAVVVMSGTLRVG